MTHSENKSIAFYQEIGKVFYAIAAADKVIRKEEIDTLRAVVRSEWLNLDQTFDEFGTDSAYQIEIVFDWFDDKNVNAAHALDSLQAFKKDHPFFFNPMVNDLILKTASAIISSFNGNNKSELIALSRLESILKK